MPCSKRSIPCRASATRPVALHEPRFGARERELVLDCIDTNWVSSAGKYVTQFEQMVAAATGARHAIAIVNGTAALHAALLLEGVAGKRRSASCPRSHSSRPRMR